MRRTELSVSVHIKTGRRNARHRCTFSPCICSPLITFDVKQNAVHDCDVVRVIRRAMSFTKLGLQNRTRTGPLFSKMAMNKANRLTFGRKHVFSID